MGLLHHFWTFISGIVRRFYFWAPALLLDPFDLYNLVKPESWPGMMVPNWIGWAALVLLLFWSAFLTYLEVARLSVRSPDWRIWEKKDAFELCELACLLEGFEPQLPLPKVAKRTYEKLTSLMKQKKISPKSTSVIDAIQIAHAIVEDEIVFLPSPHLKVSNETAMKATELVKGKHPLFNPESRL